MGALKGRPELKWLDLVAFCKSARPDMKLGKIYFFTASISERYPGDDAPRKQEKYLRVLANQGIEVVRGKFRKDRRFKTVVTTERTRVIQPAMPKLFGATQFALDESARLAAPDAPKALVFDVEEKGSDVNLASYLLRDVFTRGLDAALVISGDSDFVTPLRMAVDAGVDVHLLVPRKKLHSEHLRRAVTNLNHISQEELVRFQLPKLFVSPRGRHIVRPNSWN
jgi:uncharacterized LabA/DUF88 family protein